MELLILSYVNYNNIYIFQQFFQNLNEEIYLAKLKEETLNRKYSSTYTTCSTKSYFVVIFIMSFNVAIICFILAAADGLRTELEEEFKIAQKYRMELGRYVNIKLTRKHYCYFVLTVGYIYRNKQKESRMLHLFRETLFTLSAYLSYWH